MIQELPIEAKRLLADPAHVAVTDMLLQLVSVSYEDAMTRLLFSSPPPSAAEEAVLKAEGRILMGLRKNLADAFRLSRGQANPDAKARENSPGGFV